MKKDLTIGQIGKIERTILFIRDEKVILDADLAEFYGVTIKRLREQVRRNADRFPEDFLFRLSHKEKRQVADACPHLSNIRHSRTLPIAFTEHGAIMVATILNSKRAVEMSVFIVRAFIKLRETVGTHKEIARRINQLEKKIIQHDEQIASIIEAIKQLISAKPVPAKRRIGFKSEETR